MQCSGNHGAGQCRAGGSSNTSAVLLFFWLSIIFLALGPGQCIWATRRQTVSGHVHSIIGVPGDDDLRVLNHRAARRHQRVLRR